MALDFNFPAESEPRHSEAPSLEPDPKATNSEPHDDLNYDDILAEAEAEAEPRLDLETVQDKRRKDSKQNKAKVPHDNDGNDNEKGKGKDKDKDKDKENVKGLEDRNEAAKSNRDDHEDEDEDEKDDHEGEDKRMKTNKKEKEKEKEKGKRKRNREAQQNSPCSPMRLPEDEELSIHQVREFAAKTSRIFADAELSRLNSSIMSQRDLDPLSSTNSSVISTYLFKPSAETRRTPGIAPSVDPSTAPSNKSPSTLPSSKQPSGLVASPLEGQPRPSQRHAPVELHASDCDPDTAFGTVEKAIKRRSQGQDRT